MSSSVSAVSFQGTNAIELATQSIRLTAVTDYAPRIAFLNTADAKENLLLWEPGKYMRGNWDLRGGHRVWVTRPMADENEDTYFPDNDPCEVEYVENGFCVTSARDERSGTRRGFKVTALDDQRLEVDHFVINDTDVLYSGGLWGLTCTIPSGGSEYGVPLGDGSGWDTFNMLFFRRWADHEGNFADDQFEVKPETLLIHPRGRENKRMLEAHKGIIAMTDRERNLTFAKKMHYDPACQYPKQTNIAAYVGPENFMVEIETMGNERTLKPGEVHHHKEIWVLTRETVDLEDTAELETLFA